MWLLRMSVLVLAISSCGKRTPDPMPDPTNEEPARVERRASAFATASPETRTFANAIAGLDQETMRWIEDVRQRRNPADAPPPPAAAKQAIDALVAWDRSRGELTITCLGHENAVLVPGMQLALAALWSARSIDDPAVSAVLRLGHAARP